MMSKLIYSHSKMLTAALLYAFNGIPVFPLQPNSKLPALRGSWKEYATTDPETITRWFTNTDYNLAAALGKRSRLMALDVDMKSGRNGWQSLSEIEPFDYNQPVQRTPTGGFHVFMDYMPGITNFARKGKYSGLDMRTEGGYVVMAPSVINGVPYEFVSVGETKKPNGKLIEFLKSASTARSIVDAMMPEPTPIDQLTPLNEVMISPRHKEFLLNGVVDPRYDNDRSAALFAATRALYVTGLSDADVLGYLENSFAMDLARERRPAHSQIDWLWKYNCLTAKPSTGNFYHDNTIPPVNINEAFPDSLLRKIKGVPEVPLIQAQIDEVPDDDQLVEAQENKDKFNRLTERADNLEADDNDGALRIYMEANELGSVYASSIMNHLTLWSRKDLDKDMKRIKDRERNTGINWKFRKVDGNPHIVKENVKILLKRWNMKVRYNKMTNDIEISKDGVLIENDCDGEYGMGFIHDLCEIQNMRDYYKVEKIVKNIAVENDYHPVAELLNSVQWDGYSRCKLVFDTIKSDNEELKNLFLFKWCLGCVALLDDSKEIFIAPKTAIVFVGKQHIGKTSWLRYLTIGTGAFGEGMHLNMEDKDTKLQALSFWITELGEIDRTFNRSEASALKSFIGNRSDKIRPPYAKTALDMRRRTMFAGTVNQSEFLKDDTGNVRYLPIEVMGKIDLNTMQQLKESGGMLQFWKEIQYYYQQGYEWWLTPEETEVLQAYSRKYEEIGPYEQKLLDAFDWENTCPRIEWMDYTEIARYLNINTTSIVNWRKPLRQALIKLTGLDSAQQKKVNGKNKRAWPMPIKAYN